ncbi:choice-of-anchor L domain-containing protein [Nannocystaceae bacterium ST9]
MRLSLATATALSLAACEYRAVVGMREPDDLVADDESESDGDEPLLDVPVQACDPPIEVGCDDLDDDPLHAVGLDCIGGTPASGGVMANAEAWSVYAGTLGPGTFAPREGEKFLILSTGRASELPLLPEQLEQLGCGEPNFCPNTDFEQLDEFPPPIDVAPVDPALTCIDQPQLVGTGDCSNSLGAQCNANCEVHDYAELRIGLTVPDATYGLAFDFAFMSVEWPDFTGGGFNDMFVAWLESEQWTGNVSFDAEGNPITVNAGFLDYQGGPELEGFAMAGHGATRWLTTHFGVLPGESIVLVLAVLDLADGYYDSAVLLDHFRWTCSDAPPITQPQP